MSWVWRFKDNIMMVHVTICTRPPQVIKYILTWFMKKRFVCNTTYCKEKENTCVCGNNVKNASSLSRHRISCAITMLRIHNNMQHLSYFFDKNMWPRWTWKTYCTCNRVLTWYKSTYKLLQSWSLRKIILICNAC